MGFNQTTPMVRRILVAVVLGVVALTSGGLSPTRRAEAADCVLGECTLTVPAGVTSVTFDVLGGQGAPSGARTDLALGGRGGRVTATIAVNPGDQFVYRAGATGDNPTLGAGGGRSSTVWRVGPGGDRTAVIIAGGGGGAGHTAPRGRGGVGGAGGQTGEAGGAGARDPDLTCGTAGLGGGGGTASTGGEGGLGGTATGCTPPEPNVGNPGGPGSPGQGGD